MVEPDRMKCVECNRQDGARELPLVAESNELAGNAARASVPYGVGGVDAAAQPAHDVPRLQDELGGNPDPASGPRASERAAAAAAASLTQPDSPTDPHPTPADSSPPRGKGARLMAECGERATVQPGCSDAESGVVNGPPAAEVLCS